MFPGVSTGVGIEVRLVVQGLLRVPNSRIDIEVLIPTSTTNCTSSVTTFKICARIFKIFR
jgi:hypothetical protein